ncbi:MAG: hypothetical protein JWP88_1710, partial [Flaviaesturariibacter sp.]|nr:hypothetical protein [Flaviaesturariibacter sp.]
MRSFRLTILCLFVCFAATAQTKTKSAKYPSLLWEIRGKGLKKPSYLFGTMHVSSKMVFNLSDSFYLGIKNADVVSLEVNPDSWQANLNRYDINPLLGNGYLNTNSAAAKDYLRLGTLAFKNTDKDIETALSSNPSVINNLLYRANGFGSSDFQEDTYLDMHIFQTGKRWGKRATGVEDFDKSMQLMMEAYVDAAKDEKKKERATDIPEEYSFAKLQDAYRNGNLDLLDTINKVNSTSADFDEKFLYLRNELQAAAIDSIIRSGSSLFVGVGAAHLPGTRGVIELLRRKGYQLRPIKMSERDSRYKEESEKIRVPVVFSTQYTADSFIKVSVPGPLYKNNVQGGLLQQQFADMGNGAYYMLTRVPTNGSLWGHDIKAVYKKVDSVLYENIPGKIISKKPIQKGGYPGFDITNRTRRGDVQRYQIFVTPFEVLVFKMSGNGDYVAEGTEAATFFNSIELKEPGIEWRAYSPTQGGFQVRLPQRPTVVKGESWQFMSTDPATGNAYEVLRTDIHNYDFIGPDSIDLDLMEESFASSEFIDKATARKRLVHAGLPALDVDYKHKDGSLSRVRYLIQGPHYYTLIAHGKTATADMPDFLNSFKASPLQYGAPRLQVDSALHYSVSSPVAILPKEITDLPFDAFKLFEFANRKNNDDSLYIGFENKSKLIVNDTTGEKIYVNYYKASPYYFDKDSSWIDFMSKPDALSSWVVRMRKDYIMPGGIRAWDYIISDSGSSRAFLCKLMYRNGMAHKLTTQIDTSGMQSSFVSQFYNSFLPQGGEPGNDVYAKKSALFFGQFFSKDTVQHKRAIKNIYNLVPDSTDLAQLKRSISSLSWKEKTYVDVKKAFIDKLGEIPASTVTDYLKTLYTAAGDTIELQHTVLESLLRQKTAYAYQTFKDIVLNDPPVLEVDGNNNNSSIYKDEDGEGANGSFMDELGDSAQLSATIFKDILPLVNLDDYKHPVMQLLGKLIDSNLIVAKDYEIYMQKFLLEGKQEWKKQVVTERSKSIAAAQKSGEEDEEDNGNGNENNYGNGTLNLYATILLPFWDTHPSVPTLFNQMLGSQNNRFKYNLAYLMLRNGKPLPDTMLKYYASLPDYRYEVYSDLNFLKKQSAYPAGFKDLVALARAKLVYNARYNNKPDTLIYLDKLPMTFKGKSGQLYFFKYKDKKTDNSWKIATAGIVPADGKSFEFMKKDDRYVDGTFDFTDFTDIKIKEDEPLKEQLQKAMKQQFYTKFSSADEFYKTEQKYNFNYDD